MKSCCAVVVLGLFSNLWYFGVTWNILCKGWLNVTPEGCWGVIDFFRCMLSDFLLSSLSYDVRICDFNLLFNVVKDTWVLSLKSTHKGMDWVRLYEKRSEDNKKQFIFAYISKRLICRLWSLGVFLGMMYYLMLEHHIRIVQNSVV